MEHIYIINVEKLETNNIREIGWTMNQIMMRNQEFGIYIAYNDGKELKLTTNKVISTREFIKFFNERWREYKKREDVPAPRNAIL